ncbi:hypothetical protein B0H66DRAFT_539546 [Apodospora peruviana]|uniref:Uncharacterized protein n=1 Tax=Apodospora peruviana TaxID=516989 RepID=A0AAE0IPA7_9PEZI|nr:hypothetical protein B0H66DRAFT_539546 [Apodospora peruviana]
MRNSYIVFSSLSYLGARILLAETSMVMVIRPKKHVNSIDSEIRGSGNTGVGHCPPETISDCYEPYIGAYVCPWRFKAGLLERGLVYNSIEQFVKMAAAWGLPHDVLNTIAQLYLLIGYIYVRGHT